MTEQKTMWRAVVFSDGGTTPCGITIGQPEVLPGLYATAELAQAEALAAMDARPELYSSAVREWNPPVAAPV